MNRPYVIEEVWLDRVDWPTLLAIGQLIAIVWPKTGVTATDRATQLAAFADGASESAVMIPKSFIVRDNARVVAHAAAIPRAIGTTAGELIIVGLSRVATHPDLRGRGLGASVAMAVLALVDKGDFAASLFQTSHAMQAYYERLGCTIVDNRVVNSMANDPTTNPFRDDLAMRYPATSDWPSGPIDLRGAGY